MPKGFGGIEQLATEHSSAQKIDVTDDFVISYSKYPNLPAPWHSEDEGEAWECGDYIIILQKHPATILELAKAIASKEPLKFLKAKDDMGLRYLWALSLFYKPGKNPSGIDSYRPASVLVINQINIQAYLKLTNKSSVLADPDSDSDGWSPPTFSFFTPKTVFDYNTIDCEPTRESAKKIFFESISKMLPEKPNYIGTIADAKRLKHQLMYSCEKTKKTEEKKKNTHAKPKFKKPYLVTALILIIGIAFVGGMLLYMSSDKTAWAIAEKENSVKSYRKYLKNNPNGDHQMEASTRITHLININFSKLKKPYMVDEVKRFLQAYPEYNRENMDEAFFLNARQENKLSCFRNYLKAFPNGKYSKSAKDEIMNLEIALWEKNKFSKNEAELQKLAEEVENTSIVAKINQRIDDLYKDFSFVSQKNTKEAYQRFIELNPSSADVKIAQKRIIDIEVSEIAKGKFTTLPASSPISYSRGANAKIELTNDTQYKLTIRYSGQESLKITLNAHEKETITLPTGTYKIAVTAEGGRVRPFYGTKHIESGRYTESFYIQSHRRYY